MKKAIESLTEIEYQASYIRAHMNEFGASPEMTEALQTLENNMIALGACCAFDADDARANQEHEDLLRRAH